jgi:hypothetical protein
MSHTKLRIIFDKIHVSFIDELNKATSNEFKHGDSYDTLHRSLDIGKLIVPNPSTLNISDFSDLEILDGVKVSSFIDKISSLNSVRIFFVYVKILGAIIEQIEKCSDDDVFITALQNARNGKEWTFKSENGNINVLLKNIYTLSKNNDSNSKEKDPSEENGGDEGDEEVGAKPTIDMSFVENSKIGKLAKEISEELDFSSISNMDDISKFMDPNNNFIGDIVSKVGTKIHNKLSSGDIKQEDLLSEAFGLMNSFGGKVPGNMSDIFNNPMMKSVLGSLGGFPPGKGGKSSFNNGKMRQMSARERLKTKLKEKSPQ